MAYNTGNPVGSTDPRDLYDNAGNLDKFVSGDASFYPDRLGKQRLSYAGMEQDFENSQEGREAEFQQFLADSAFVFIGDYAAGLNFTSRSQYTIRDGVPYRIAPSTTLPYLATGNWATEQSKFTPINSDDILRQDLAASDSDVLVGGQEASKLGDLADAITIGSDGRARATKFIAGDEILVSPATRDAIVVGRNVIGSTDCHAFADRTVMSGVTDAGTYGVFDATTRLEGSNSQNHIYSFQHRVSYAGSGVLGQLAGLLSRPVHAGTGLVNATFGADIGTMSITAGGTITEQTGVRVRDQVGATVNVAVAIDQVAGYSVYAAGGGLMHNKGRVGCGIVPNTSYALQYAGTAASARRGFLETTATSLQIGAEGDGVTQFINAAASRWEISATSGNSALVPGADNVYPFGSPSRRPSVLHAGTATINTSDGREKNVDRLDWKVRSLTANELAAAIDLSREIGAYKFLSSIKEKGDGAREHIGMTVQRAIAIIESHGLDPFAYSFICYDEWEASPAVIQEVKLGKIVTVESGEVLLESVESSAEELGKTVWQYTHSETVQISPAIEQGNRYSFRETGLLAFIAAGFEARLSALESS